MGVSVESLPAAPPLVGAPSFPEASPSVPSFGSNLGVPSFSLDTYTPNLDALNSTRELTVSDINLDAFSDRFIPFSAPTSPKSELKLSIIEQINSIESLDLLDQPSGIETPLSPGLIRDIEGIEKIDLLEVPLAAEEATGVDVEPIGTIIVFNNPDLKEQPFLQEVANIKPKDFLEKDPKTGSFASPFADFKIKQAIEAFQQPSDAKFSTVDIKQSVHETSILDLNDESVLVSEGVKTDELTNSINSLFLSGVDPQVLAEVFKSQLLEKNITLEQVLTDGSGNINIDTAIGMDQEPEDIKHAKEPIYKVDVQVLGKREDIGVKAIEDSALIEGDNIKSQTVVDLMPEGKNNSGVISGILKRSDISEDPTYSDLLKDLAFAKNLGSLKQAIKFFKKLNHDHRPIDYGKGITPFEKEVEHVLQGKIPFIHKSNVLNRFWKEARIDQKKAANIVDFLNEPNLKSAA